MNSPDENLRLVRVFGSCSYKCDLLVHKSVASKGSLSARYTVDIMLKLYAPPNHLLASLAATTQDNISISNTRTNEISKKNKFKFHHKPVSL